MLQRLGERVDLEEHLAQRIVAARAPRARIEKSSSRIAASRFETVWSGRTRRSRSDEAKPSHEEDDHGRQRPADLRREVADPQEQERHDDGGQRGERREQQDAPVVARDFINREFCPSS